MEFASRLRWGLVIITVLIALILVVWGMFSIAKSIFQDDSSSSTAQEVESVEFDVKSASVARFTVDGPVVANQEHQSYTIEVSENVVTMKVFNNYGQIVVTEQSYTNNEVAYQTFLSALEKQDVTERKKDTSQDDDYAEQGVCATGKRYILEIDSDLRRWSTSCSVQLGTSVSSLNAVRTLFQKQVVDYKDLVKGTGL